MTTHVIRLPMYVPASKNGGGKTQAVNLNVYRNQHYQSSNNQKRNFCKKIKLQLRDLPKMGSATIHYEVCPKRKGRFDVMNIVSIADKFFADALVDFGILPDDDYRYLPSGSYSFGGFKDNGPYVLAHITDTSMQPSKGVAPMRVLLDQTDFEKAVKTYVAKQGIPNAQRVDIAVVDGNIVAEVFLNSDAQLSETQPTAAPATTVSDTPDPVEAERLELVAEAQALKIKGIRSNMTIETLREKLQEHNDANTGDANADENSEGGSSSSATGPSVLADGGDEGSEAEATEGDNSANPSEESEDGSSETEETSDSTEAEDAPEVEEQPKRKKSSIFDV